MSGRIPGWPAADQTTAALATMEGRISTVERRGPQELATIANTGKTANIATTTLLQTPRGGLYEVMVYLKTTTAGSGGDTLTATIGWNDGTAQTANILNAVTLAALNGYSQARLTCYVAAGQTITYATTLAAAGAPVYDLRLDALWIG